MTGWIVLGVVGIVVVGLLVLALKGDRILHGCSHDWCRTALTSEEEKLSKDFEVCGSRRDYGRRAWIPDSDYATRVCLRCRRIERPILIAAEKAKIRRARETERHDVATQRNEIREERANAILAGRELPESKGHLALVESSSGGELSRVE